MVFKGGTPRRRARQRLVSLSRMTRDAAPCARCDGHGGPPAPRPTESSGMLRATVHRVDAPARNPSSATRASKNETGSHARSRTFTNTAIGGKADGSLLPARFQARLLRPTFKISAKAPRVVV